IQNSKDEMPIVLRAEIESGRLRLSVSDSGAGVPESIREHMFEPFATGRPDGTGLGLAIVREAAEAHGGRVILEHRSNGTTFTLELPAGAVRDLGYAPVVASSGREALAVAARTNPDAALLDLRMPDMDGLQVLTR